jgi:DNA-binding transcriptional regulator YiaG
MSSQVGPVDPMLWLTFEHWKLMEGFPSALEDPAAKPPGWPAAGEGGRAAASRGEDASAGDGARSATGGQRNVTGYAVPRGTVRGSWQGAATPTRREARAHERECVARNLRALRERSGFKVAEVARLVGVESGTVRGWLNGKHTPDERHRVALARVYGVHVSALFDGV